MVGRQVMGMDGLTTIVGHIIPTVLTGVTILFSTIHGNITMVGVGVAATGPVTITDTGMAIMMVITDILNMAVVAETIMAIAEVWPVEL